MYGYNIKVNLLGKVQLKLQVYNSGCFYHMSKKSYFYILLFPLLFCGTGQLRWMKSSTEEEILFSPIQFKSSERLTNISIHQRNLSGNWENFIVFSVNGAQTIFGHVSDTFQVLPKRKIQTLEYLDVLTYPCWKTFETSPKIV